jgi:hypothetical protein
MWFEAGDKTTQVLLESGSISLDFTNDSVRTAYITALASNHGVSLSNVSFYYLLDTDVSVLRIRNGDTWVPTWSGSAPTGELNGVSFTTEDAKKWLDFSTDKTSAVANSKDRLTISVNVLTANKSGIDTTFSGDIDIPISLPEGQSKARFTFFTGKSSKAFKFANSGSFSIGSRKLLDYRMNNTLNVDVVL